MAHPAEPTLARRIFSLAAALRTVDPLALLPLATFLAWLAGEAAMLLVLGGLGPLLVLVERGRARSARRPRRHRARDAVTGLPLRAELDEMLGEILAQMPDTGLATACFAIGLDDFEKRSMEWGGTGTDEVLRALAGRLGQCLRPDDVAVPAAGGFLIGLGPVRRLDLDALLDIAERLQKELQRPVALDGLRVHPTVSIGVAPVRRDERLSASGLVARAEAALLAALRTGPAAIRVHEPNTPPAAPASVTAIARQVESALERGEIRPWFQPQVSTETGRVSGFEALARWQHPEFGLLTPGEFLPAAEEAGLMPRLGDVILEGALRALRDWRRAGLQVPAVAVNYSSSELSDPKLADRLLWQVDRFDLTPRDLVLEILEEVVTETDNDVVVRTVRRLTEKGFRIDLDDFGTSHASIAHIRRFRVSRIKIDRSFISGIDRDEEQRRMVGAILALAERLELGTVAEGVETLNQHALLAQLGCDHVQGYGIARPMPFEETLPWLRQQASTASSGPLSPAPSCAPDPGKG